MVQATSGSEVKTMGFDLVYDPAYFAVVRVTEAAFLKQGNAVTEFVGNPVEGADRVTININRPTGGARGTGAVAVVVLRSLTEPGTAELSIENTKVLDTTGKSVGINLSPPTRVTVTP